MPDPERFRLTLRALPADAPAVTRLRAALKLFLRRFALRCERIEEVEENRPAEPPANNMTIGE